MLHLSFETSVRLYLMLSYKPKACSKPETASLLPKLGMVQTQFSSTYHVYKHIQPGHVKKGKLQQVQVKFAASPS